MKVCYYVCLFTCKIINFEQLNMCETQNKTKNKKKTQKGIVKS